MIYYSSGTSGPAGQDLATTACAGPVPADRQVHARQGHHRLQHLHGQGGGGGHRGRNQRRAGSKEGRRRLRHGHRRHGRGQGGLRYHTHRRQLHEHSEGSDVGQERVRFHLQVPAVPAHRQRGGRGRGLCRRLRHPGQSAQGRPVHVLSVPLLQHFFGGLPARDEKQESMFASLYSG